MKDLKYKFHLKKIIFWDVINIIKNLNVIKNK